jgi:hypothetical protein
MGMKVRGSRALLLPGSLGQMSFEQRPKNGALELGVKMTRQRLKLGLGLICAAVVCGGGLFGYGAAAVQPTGAIPVDCSHARGREGADYLRQPDRPICSMPWTAFRRLYPEIAEHTDESSWSG